MANPHQIDVEVEKSELENGELPKKSVEEDDIDFLNEKDQDLKWAIITKKDHGKPWKEKSCQERFKTVLVVFLKIVVLLGLLYIFICSLGMLGDAFKLLGGKAAGEAFRNNDILSNPIADLMMGILVTVLLQSSSTTTSIVVAMVAEEVIPMKPAIFIVMGANIGTSVTNTIVSMGQVYDRNEYRRSFAGATVHDMFNWLAVLTLLPIEWISSSVGPWGKENCGMLCQLSAAVLKSARGGSASNPELLKKITKPFLKKIVQIDKKIVTAIAQNPNISAGDVTMVKAYHCSHPTPYAEMVNGSCELLYKDVKDSACDFLFEDLAAKWAPKDWKLGLCVLFLALALLLISLVAIVKLLNSLLKGTAARVVQKVLNFKIPKPFTWLTGYLAMLVGCGFTILVQSSSIFTSTMTPLVGAGILHIKRMYPLTLGANIGTTFTAVLASLAIDSDGFERSMQIALVHLFFNIIGIILWYPIPAMRHVPINLAKGLGNTTAKHRWFAIFYILMMFLALPAAIFGLSVAGWKVALGVILPLFVLFIVIVIIRVMQKKCPQRMHPKMRNCDWLPRPCRSLSFYDSILTKCCRCCKIKEKQQESEVVRNTDNVMSYDDSEMPPGYDSNRESMPGYTNEALETDDYTGLSRL